MDDREGPGTTLAPWNPTTMKPPFACLMVASRNSGKSTLIRSLWHSQLVNHFDIVLTFCSTDFDEAYQDTFPGSLFYEELQSAVIERTLKVQEQRKKQNKKMAQVLVVVDDLSTDRERYDPMLKRLYTRGRHYDVSVIFSTQATQLSDPVWRNNSDYVFIGRQMGARAREVVVEQFLMGSVDSDDLPSGVKEKTFLKRVVRDNTRDYSFVVVDYNQGSGDLVDTMYHYKAPALPQVA